LTLIVIIGALLVLSAVLVTVLLLTRGTHTDVAPPSPSATTAVPTTTPPTTAPPTTQAPTTPPPTTPPPTTPPPTTPPVTTVVPGVYDCTNAGQFVGSVTFQGNNYETNNQSRGTYQLDPTNSGISFTGGDLAGFTGRYFPSGPSMDLTQTGEALHCAQ
jgi:cytoskeletal protein RodZ